MHYVKTCPAWTTERQACDPARHPTSLRLVQRQNIWGIRLSFPQEKPNSSTERLRYHCSL